MAEGNKKVEETEEKPKSLIDRFWWVIPPVFIIFVYIPFGLMFLSILLGHSLSEYPPFTFERYILGLKKLYIPNYIGDVKEYLIISFFIFGPMVLGILFTKGESLKLRITIPITLAILGTLIVTVFIAILMLLGMWGPLTSLQRLGILGSFIVMWGIAIHLWLLPMRHQVRFLWKLGILGSFIVMWGIAIRLWLPRGDQWELTLLGILGLLIIALVRALLWMGSYCRPLERGDENGI
jgi:hypothetical protein